MSALIPVNSTVSVNDFMNGYFDSVSTVDNIGETDKLLLVQNGELKAASGDNLVSETTIENNFASWANSYLPVGSTATPSLISGAQSQKLANLTTATATSGTKGYMSAADKYKLDNLSTYARVGGDNLENGLVNAITTTYDKPRFFSIAPGVNTAAWHDGITNTGMLATTSSPGLMSAADKTDLEKIKLVSITLDYIQGEYVLNTAQRAYNHANMPKGKTFVATIACGSLWTMVGYWYTDLNYGFCTFSNFVSSYFIRLDDGEWSVTNLARSTGSTVSIKIGAATAKYMGIRRYGNVRVLNIDYGNGVAFGDINQDTAIGQVEDEDKPFAEVSGILMARNQGAWATATYYPALVYVNTAGQIFIRGKQSEMAATQYIRGQIVWITG